MKQLRSILLVLLSLVMVVLCACPGPVGPDSSSTTTSSNTGGGDPNLPTGAVYRPSDTGERAAYWQKLSAPTGNYAKDAYVAASGLSNESATLTAGTDLAHAFTAPYDGLYEVSADMLALAAADGEVALAVYKNGAKIWPVSEDAYIATTQNGADRFTATTSAKKGDVIYVRASGNTTVNLSPRVTFVAGGYEEGSDIEKNFPTVGVLSDVGSSIKSDAFVMNSITEPTEGTFFGGAQIGNRIMRKQMQAGDVFFANDDEDIIIDCTGREGLYDANGAVIVTGGRVLISGLAEGCEIANLYVFAYGGVFIEESVGGILRGCKINGGVTVEEDASSLTFDGCRIVGSGVAFENRGEGTNLIDSYVEGSNLALLDTAEKGNALYYNCILKGYHTAVSMGASDTIVRGCTVYGDIVSEAGLENLLVAECVMKNLGTIVYDGTHNSVILFNEVENVAVKNATNAYVCENAIYGGLLFDKVRYMIAEDNALATAVPALVSVEDYNGDNVTDITAREEVGVNEDLLPHVNMDTFINMERKTVVRAPDRESEKEIALYIRDELYAGKRRVIVAPGAYYTPRTLWITDVKDADIFGYGVLFEIEDCKTAGFSVNRCERVGFYGITVGYAESTSDQLIVLKKLSGNKILCVNAAGTQVSWRGNEMIPEAHRYDEPYPYSPDFGSESAVKGSDGMWTLGINESRYEEIRVGDVISCRNGTSIFKMTETKSIYYEDFSVVGGSIRCFWDHKAIEGSIMHRVIDVPAAAKRISESEYNRYKQIEQAYGLPENYLVYIDEFGNYRGMAARTASADFAHTSDSVTGFTVISCIVSGLSDDGSNHQGWFDRVWKYDEDTGIITYRYDNYEQVGNADKLRPFKKGDRVCIFTSTGRLLVDTPALEDSVNNKATGVATVKIDKNLLKEADLAEYDMENYDWYSVRVLIDNMSRNGAGAYFDNSIFENIRSRGLMLKCEDAVIQYCTLRNIGMSAIAILYEIDWRESGFANDVVIKNNYIENTGYADNKAFYSPISLFAPAVQGTDDYHSFRNFTIEGNVVRNRGTSQALYACGVENLVIKNNDFGDHILWDPTQDVSYYDENMDTTPVLITFSKNVEISDNIYTSIYENSAATQAILSATSNVFGTDVSGTIDDVRVVGAKKTTSYANHVPVKKEGGGLIFSGGWDVGYVNQKGASLSLTSFDNLSGSDQWFSSGSTLWSIGGIASYYREYRYVLWSQTGIAIRHTVDEDATVAISFARFYPPSKPTASSLEGSDDALYAIFVGGEMVWPTQGGSYTSIGDWYHITKHTSHAEMERAIADLRIEVSEGDEILFVAKTIESGAHSFFAAVPNVYYLD